MKIPFALLILTAAAPVPTIAESRSASRLVEIDLAAPVVSDATRIPAGVDIVLRITNLSPVHRYTVQATPATAEIPALAFPGAGAADVGPCPALTAALASLAAADEETIVRPRRTGYGSQQAAARTPPCAPPRPVPSPPPSISSSSGPSCRARP